MFVNVVCSTIVTLNSTSDHSMRLMELQLAAVPVKSAGTTPSANTATGASTEQVAFGGVACSYFAFVDVAIILLLTRSAG